MFFILSLIASLSFNLITFPDGRLDPSFGINGQVITFFPSHGASQIPRNIRIQTDGKILVGGRNNQIGGPCAFVNRYNLDGSLDTTFGDGGQTIICYPNGTFYAADMVLQPDNKIIIGITTTSLAGNDTIVVARLLTDGSLDTSFGNNGFGELEVVTGGVGRQLAALALQTDGSIVVATTSNTAVVGLESVVVPLSSVANNGIVARFLSNGDIDTSFGTNGNGFVVVDPTTFGGNALFFFGIQIQHDGKIVVFGDMVTTIDVFLVARLLTDGTFDPEFGTDGIMLADVGTGAAGGIIQSDGKILSYGSNNTPPLYVIRLLPNGAFDTSFANNGVGTYPLSGNISNMNCIGLQSDGKIVAANSYDSQDPDPNFLQFTTLRINTDGSIDTTFGVNGYVNTFVLGQPNCQTFGVEVNTNGDIYTVGTVGNTRVGLVKYLISSIIYGPLSKALAARYYNQDR